MWQLLYCKLYNESITKVQRYKGTCGDIAGRYSKIWSPRQSPTRGYMELTQKTRSSAHLSVQVRSWFSIPPATPTSSVLPPSPDHLPVQHVHPLIPFIQSQLPTEDLKWCPNTQKETFIYCLEPQLLAKRKKRLLYGCVWFIFDLSVWSDLQLYGSTIEKAPKLSGLIVLQIKSVRLMHFAC